MDIETAISEMLGAIGEANAPIDAVMQIEQFAWIVSFADDTRMEVEADVKNARLIVFTDLGKPKADEKSRIMQTMLNYNLLWQETGGLRMGLSGDGANALLIGDTPLPDVSEAVLDEMIYNLSKLAGAWRLFVATGSMVSGGTNADPSEDMMIRV